MKIPLLCDLAECSISEHISAMKEIFFTLFFSFMPLWLGAFFIVASEGSSYASVLNSIVKNVSNGELLIYCNAIVAPIFFVALEEKKGKETFPSKIFHLSIFILVLIFSAVAFALQRVGFDFNDEFIMIVSLTSLVVSLVILYTSSVLNRGRKDLPNKVMSDQTTSFVDQYRRRREVKND